MRKPSLFRRLRDDSAGSVIIEFALIGPTMIAMLLGVLQFGIGMQNYNALRAISAETARFAVITRQQDGAVVDTAVETYARQIAIVPPFGLQTGQFTVDCADAGTQRVLGATEKTLTLTYSIPSVLSIIGIGAIPLTYTRPIFLVT
jgi:Flp pilus assembly protein TadG